MPWVPEWLGREGRPVHDFNTKEWEMYRAEVARIRLECDAIDEESRFSWVWRDGPTAGSRLLTPVFAASEYAMQSHPGCQMGLHPDFGMVVFWNERVFIWQHATEEEVAKDAVVGGFFAFGQEVQEDDARQVLMDPSKATVHETAGHVAMRKRTNNAFAPRADDTHIWILETTKDQTWVRRYPLADPVAH